MTSLSNGYMQKFEETYQEAQVKARARLEAVLDEYKDMDPIKRIKMIHKKIESLYKKHKAKLSCEKGCSHCCYFVVGITEDEAKLLAPMVDDAVTDKLETQRYYSTDPNMWNAMPKHNRKCPFLGDSDECSVYADRPIGCRNYNTVTDKSFCVDEKFEKIKFYRSESIEHYVSLALNLSKSGAMAPMILDALDEK